MLQRSVFRSWAPPAGEWHPALRLPGHGRRAGGEGCGQGKKSPHPCSMRSGSGGSGRACARLPAQVTSACHVRAHKCVWGGRGVCVTWFLKICTPLPTTEAARCGSGHARSRPCLRWWHQAKSHLPGLYLPLCWLWVRPGCKLCCWGQRLCHPGHVMV